MSNENAHSAPSGGGQPLITVLVNEQVVTLPSRTVTGAQIKTAAIAQGVAIQVISSFRKSCRTAPAELLGMPTRSTGERTYGSPQSHLTTTRREPHHEDGGMHRHRRVAPTVSRSNGVGDRRWTRWGTRVPRADRTGSTVCAPGDMVRVSGSRPVPVRRRVPRFHGRGCKTKRRSPFFGARHEWSFVSR